jgi:hypothetical protein
VADGVVLHAVVDLLAALTAAATAMVVSRLTALLGPVRVVRREVVLAAAADRQMTAGPDVTPSPPTPAAPA